MHSGIETMHASAELIRFSFKKTELTFTPFSEMQTRGSTTTRVLSQTVTKRNSCPLYVPDRLN